MLSTVCPPWEKSRTVAPPGASLRADQRRKSHPKTGWICKTPQQHPPQVQPTTLLLHYDGANLCVIMLKDLSVRATVHSSHRPPLLERDEMQLNCGCVHMTHAFMWSPCELRLQYLYLRWPSDAAGTRTNSYLSLLCCAVGLLHFWPANPFSLPAKFYSRNFYDYYIIFLNARIRHTLCFCSMVFSSQAQLAPHAPVPPFRSVPNQSWRDTNQLTQTVWNTKTFSVVLTGSFTTVWAHSAKVWIGNTFIYL